MHNGSEAGRVLKVSLRPNWSGAVILMLVVWALAGSAFANLYPSWGLAGWGAALVVSTLFFASVLLHGMAHGLAAFLLGGPAGDMPFSSTHASRTAHAPLSPAAEFMIALAGPLTSVSLGALMLISVAAVTAGPDPTASDAPWSVAGLGPLAMLVVWMGSANVLLGVLNLVPGSPLDGGAMLHSFLWAAVGEPNRASDLATRVARVAAWGLIAAGLLTIALAPTTWTLAGVFGGMALVLIGWLVARAAEQYMLESAIDEILEGMPVTVLPGGEILSVPPNIPVSSLLNDYVLGANDWTWPVIDQGRLVGLVHPADVRNVPLERWDTTEVGEIMTCIDQWLEAKNMA